MIDNNQPQITVSEVQEWEDKFKTQVSPQVQFDVPKGKQTSMQLYNGASGLETTWKGSIILGSDNFINWTFSLQNDPFVDVKMSMTEDHYNIFVKLYNFYGIWKKEWGQEMSVPPSESPAETNAPTPNPAGGGTPPLPLPSGMGGNEKPGGMSPLGESKSARNKENIIFENSDRMRRLAGLKH